MNYLIDLDLLRKAVIDCGMSISEIIRQSGVSRKTIYDALNGTTTPTFSTIHRICQTINCDPNTIIIWGVSRGGETE